MALTLTSSIFDRLPSVIPQKKKLVEGETHEFVRMGTTVGTEKTVYKLDESPYLSIRSVTATVDGSEIQLPETAYEPRTVGSDAQNAIAFTDNTVYPDAGTTFAVRYIVKPTIQRYIEPYDADIDRVDDRLDEVKDSHFIQSADEDAVEQLSAFFGELGDRRGRTTREYRRFLSSIVASFDARGTIPGIKFTIDSGLGIDADTITIAEDFEDQSYEIEFREFPPLNTGNIRDVAGAADASGVDLETLIFILQTGQIGVRTLDFERISRGQIGVFHGQDRFDSNGAFGSGDRNDVFTERTTDTTALGLDVGVPTQTTVETGFSQQSAFSAGEFDGNADRVPTQVETTTPDATVEITAGNIQSTETVRSYGSGSFGTGLFDGINNTGETRGVDEFTVEPATITVAATVDAVTVDQDLIGTDILDGSEDAGTVLSPVATIGVEPEITVETADNRFGSGILNDDDIKSSETVTPTSNISTDVTPASNTTTEPDGFGSGSFDGASDFT